MLKDFMAPSLTNLEPAVFLQPPNDLPRSHGLMVPFRWTFIWCAFTFISSSIVTAHFNAARFARGITDKLAVFDARVWTIPARVEVENYFIWRQQDATKNAISMTAHAHFSHASLQGLSTDQMQERLFAEKGINFNDLPVGFKRGRVIERQTSEQSVSYTHKRTGEEQTAMALRSAWVSVGPPIFTREREWLQSRVPEFGL